MELEDLYDIQATASYILRHGFTRVALQFPDHLLKVSVAVSSALRIELEKQAQEQTSVKLYILADTTYGSCCGDEIAAAHVNADCIIHYGHTCLSPMSKLPIWYVFGRASIDIDDCVQQIIKFGSDHGNGILVLFNLEFTYAIPEINARVLQAQQLSAADNLGIFVANVPNQENSPYISENCSGNSVSSITGIVENQLEELSVKNNGVNNPGASFSCGGLSWTIPSGSKMEDFSVVWIGEEGPALTNIMLTFNKCSFARYHPERKDLITNVSSQSKFLMRRYYLIERAKDASMVGIVVGTLGVAGYQEMVKYLKKLIKEAGKKSYTLAMGKPNPAKLANFPECDIFVLVACPQTALLDSKDFMVPVITPFEAVTAWRRGTQWTGTYSLDFRTLKECDSDSDIETKEGESAQTEVEEARFSFIKGSYIEDNHHNQPDAVFSTKALSLAKQSEEALQLQNSSNSAIASQVGARSGAEYLLSRTFQGLEVNSIDSKPANVTQGRTGRAAGYADEPS